MQDKADLEVCTFVNLYINKKFTFKKAKKQTKPERDFWRVT